MGAWTVVRVVGGLFVVIALIVISGKLARRQHGLRGAAGLRVVERVGLSREAHLAVVEVGGQQLLLGVTAHGVTRLAELEGGTPVAEPLLEVQAEVTAEATRTAAGEPAAAIAERLMAERDAEAELMAARLAAARAAEALDALPMIDDDEDDEEYERPQDERPRASREWPSTLPRNLDLDEYPDLASALRAAGRTTDDATDAPQDLATAQDDDAAEDTRPRSRAEARRLRQGAEDQARTRAAARAEAEAARAEAQAEAVRTATAAQLAATKIAALQAAAESTRPTPADAAEARRIVVPTQRSGSDEAVKQASGSVLSPATWKQGIEALRELTVRRG